MSKSIYYKPKYPYFETLFGGGLVALIIFFVKKISEEIFVQSFLTIIVGGIVIVLSIVSLLYFEKFVKYFPPEGSLLNYCAMVSGLVCVALVLFLPIVFYSFITASLAIMLLRLEILIRNFRKKENFFEEKESRHKKILSKLETLRIVLGIFGFVALCVCGLLDFVNNQDLKDNSDMKHHSNQGVINMWNRVTTVDEASFSKLKTDIEKLNVSSNEKENVLKQISDIQNKVMNTEQNLYWICLFEFFVMIVGFSYLLIVSLLFKKYPSNREIKKWLQEAFWKNNADIK